MEKHLSKLNFEKVVIYPKISGYKVENEHNFKCTGFCISCEERGILQRGEFLTQMSHGADSNDYKEIIKKDYENNLPIMIVFENPGNEFSPEHQHPSTRIIKNVPTDHYYWISDKITEAPKTPAELIKMAKEKGEYKNLYDPYMVYLQEKHNLNNIYITNLTKCKLRKNKKLWRIVPYDHVRENCINEIFRSELEIFKPKIVFCMGEKSKKWFPYEIFIENFKKWYPLQINEIEERVVQLLHPATRWANISIVRENDKRIARAITKALSLDFINLSANLADIEKA
jgi:hypothetical protein